MIEHMTGFLFAESKISNMNNMILNLHPRKPLT